ncbi:MAG: hypothetical protein KDC98_18720 [Planctomycetes bacterium]|nr:hypothetical protein [Planctomycetota bacterium]
MTLWFTALLLSAALEAQAANQREATVGMRARIDELVLPGSELTVAPATHETPIVLRIVAAYQHGDHFRYDLEWSGLEPGSYDLKDFLARKDGAPVTDLPSIGVAVSATLPERERQPSEPDPIAPPRIGGYGTEQVIAAVIWIVGLLLILFVGRRRRRAAAAPLAKPTLADRLRPIVEAAASGAASEGQKAELERMLVAFWRERLDLVDAKADRALAEIRRHDEAGRLLRQLEAWLHMPEPPAPVDVQALLAPYRHIAADALESGSRATGTGATS